MRTIVCGSEHIRDRVLFDETMRLAAEIRGIEPSLVISGAAKGPDSMALDWARERDLPWRAFPADWETYPVAAGRIRNRAMLERGRAEVVVALWDGRSPGTRHMIRLSARRNLPQFVYVPPEYRRG